jgi:hypothetical protein
MTRRRWLRRAAVWAGPLVGETLRLARGLIGGWWLLPASVRASAPPPLSAAELDTLVAFGEVIVDGRALSSEARTALTEALTGAIQGAPDRVDLYRGAVQLLDGLGGRALGRLDLADRAALITRHRLDIRAVADEPAMPDDARFIRTSLGPELVVAYWRSAAGWAAVGYQTFPGRCGDLVRYTRPEP